MFSNPSESKYPITLNEQNKITAYRDEIKLIDDQLATLEPDVEKHRKLWDLIPPVEGNILILEDKVKRTKCARNERMTYLLETKIPRGQLFDWSACYIDKEHENIIIKIYSSTGMSNQSALEEYFAKSHIPFHHAVEKNLQLIDVIRIEAKYFKKLVTWLSDKSSDFTVAAYPFYLMKKFAVTVGLTTPDIAEHDDKATTPSFCKLSDSDKHKIKELAHEIQSETEKLRDYKAQLDKTETNLNKYCELSDKRKDIKSTIQELTRPVDNDLINIMKKKFPQLYTTAIINRETQQIEICFYNSKDMNNIKKMFADFCQNPIYEIQKFTHGNSHLRVQIDVAQRKQLLAGIRSIPEIDTWDFESRPMVK